MSSLPCPQVYAALSGLLIALISLSAVNGADYYTEKPSFLPTCKIYEPGFTKCSTNSIQKLIEQIAIGIPRITEKLGSFDPMKVDQIDFKQDNNEAVTLRANLTDLHVIGFSKAQIKESRVSKKDFSWETKVFVPKMRLEGKYQMAGKILLIPLSGSGNMFIEIENLDMVLRTKTRLHEKDGFTFYDVLEVRVVLKPGGVKTNFENIFNGNSKEVERSTNQFFNDNWPEFFEALRPLVSETVERIMKNWLKNVFDVIPANFFVEDIPTSDKLYGKVKS